MYSILLVVAISFVENQNLLFLGRIESDIIFALCLSVPLSRPLKLLMFL